MCALFATQMWAVETFTMADIFTGSNQSATVTSPVNATVTTTANAGNAKDGKLGSDGDYFQIVLASGTFTAASINGYINTTKTDKNWGFQFTTNGGTTWATEVTQANDGNKSAHDITVGVTIPSGANGIRVIRRAGTSTNVYSISLTLAPTCTKPGTPGTPSVSSKTHNSANLTWTAAANSAGYKVSIVKKSDASVVVDWTDCATNSYAASGLSPETTYTFKVKAVGATGYCDLGDEASVDFATEVDPAATTYKVTLVPAGGTISDATGWTLNAGNYERVVSDGTELTLPTFTKVNHKFMTWRNNASVDVASPVTITKDTVLNAVWAEIGTYTYSYSNAKTISELNAEGWAFTNDGYGSDSKATVDLVSTLNTNGRTAAKSNGMNDNALGYLKNAEACATFDLGQAATVTGITATLYGGSSDAFNEIITFVGADGTTVKKSYTNSLSAGNWKANSIVKSDEVADVRYIKVYGAAKYVVMSAFSVSFIEFRKTVSFSANGGTGEMASMKYAEGAEVTLPECKFTAPDGKDFDAWTSEDVTISNNKFTMPNKNVTIKATWKDHVISNDATLSALSVDGYTLDPVFAPATTKYSISIAYDAKVPAKSKITATPNDANAEVTSIDSVGNVFTITVTAEDGVATKDYTITVDTLAAKKDPQIITFSNGARGSIDISNKRITVPYLSTASQPTYTEVSTWYAKDGDPSVTVEGTTLTITGVDGLTDEYTIVYKALTPANAATLAYDTDIKFTANQDAPSYIYAPYVADKYDAARGWKIAQYKDDAGNRRVTQGYTNIYFAFRPAESVMLSNDSVTSERKIEVYVNGEKKDDITSFPKKSSDPNYITIPLNTTANTFVRISQTETGGDTGITKLHLVKGSATALDNTADDLKAVKRLENGILVIEKNGRLFNAQGQLVK